jgi:arylsulfatase A-like enzyme
LSADATRKGDFFAIAAWAGLAFGVAEGAVLCFTRRFPAIVAPFKTSPHVLWIAPMLDVVLFLLIAAIILAALRIVRPRAAEPSTAVVIFAFLGFFGVISAPKIIHPASAVLLAAGLAVLLGRILKPTDERRIARLRRYTIWIPVAIGVLALGTSTALRASEWRRFRNLPSAASGSVNVLFIVLDTVRRDHFWWAGDSSYTPEIDRFALRGVRYEDAWSVTSWSLPSQASILTGTYPHEHRADWPGLRLDANIATLPAVLRSRGYVTAAFSGNSSWITPEYLGRGFDHFEVYRLEDHLRRTSYGRALSRISELVGLHYAGLGKHAPAINAELLSFLDNHKARPFFAYLCYMDVNQAFHNRKLNRGFWERPATVAEQVQASRDGLRRLDADVGALLRDLQRRGIADNTIIIITSDHGESFGAENPGDHDPEGHGTSLFPEQSRVPLFVIYPRRVPGNTAVKEAVSIRSIPATVTYLLGEPSSRSPFRAAPLPGLDSGPGQSSTGDDILATLRYGDRHAASVVSDGWQYIVTFSDDRRTEQILDVSLKEGRGAGEPGLSPATEAMRLRLRRLLPDYEGMTRHKAN